MLRLPTACGSGLCLMLVLLSSLAPGAKAQTMQDTLLPPSFSTCGTSLQTWRSPFGFVFGNNSLGDREKLQGLELPELGNGFATAVRVTYDHLSLGTPSGSMRCVAYAVGADGGPGAFLKASDTLTLSSLPAAPGEAWFNFPEPAAFTDRVYVGIDLRFLVPGDSMGVPGTENGCGSGCWPYETWSDGTRNPICDTYDLDDVDFALAVAVDWTPRVSSTADPAFESAAPWRIYPNPASSTIVLQAPTANPALPIAAQPPGGQDLHWVAVGSDGREQQRGLLKAEEGPWSMDLSDWPAGCYRFMGQWQARPGGASVGSKPGVGTSETGLHKAVSMDPRQSLFLATVCKP